MSFITLSRSFNKANIMLLINQGRLLNCKSNIIPANVLQSKLPLLSAIPIPQTNIKPFSQSPISSAAAKDHNHARHWAIERVVSITLLGLVPAAFIFPSSVMDNLLTLALMSHIHWGLESIFVDYIRPSIFGTFIPKLSIATLYFFTAFALGGLFYFNYSDVGLVKAIKMFWAL